MLSAPHNRHVNMEWRGYVMPHDRRIAAISGQPFGDAYYEGLLRSEARLDSTPPIAAILAAPKLDIAPQRMLAAVQAGHYLHGLEIAAPPCSPASPLSWALMPGASPMPMPPRWNAAPPILRTAVN